MLIDFWATWCAPCVAGLPRLGGIYQEVRDKDSVLLFVDQDEEAKTASDFWVKEGYAWPDYHDDGDMEKLMGGSSIPRLVLIDAQGKIVYDAPGANEEELRTAVAKLGPEYASLAPKPKQPLCATSN